MKGGRVCDSNGTHLANRKKHKSYKAEIIHEKNKIIIMREKRTRRKKRCIKMSAACKTYKGVEHQGIAPLRYGQKTVSREKKQTSIKFKLGRNFSQLSPRQSCAFCYESWRAPGVMLRQTASEKKTYGVLWPH